MAAKNPQNEPVTPAKMPAYFDDDLVQRCFPHKFRNVGNPYAYLNDVGVHAMVEYIAKGHLLIDVAEATNVPLMVLRKWVQEEGHFEAIEEAETLSAEGYLAEGMKRIRCAQTEFELRRAEKMVKHAQYMASKKNKPVYGEQVTKGPTGAVTYIFNVPGGKEIPKFAGQIIDAESNVVAGSNEIAAPPQASVDLGQLYGFATEANDIWMPPSLDGLASLAHLSNVSEDDIQAAINTALGEPNLILVAPRPENPTAENPDIGPFFDEPQA